MGDSIDDANKRCAMHVGKEGQGPSISQANLGTKNLLNSELNYKFKHEGVIYMFFLKKKPSKQM